MTSKFTMTALAAICAVFAASSASAATNIFPAAAGSVVAAGPYGFLLPGDPWLGGAYAPASLTEPVNGSPLAEGTQWNAGSFWWTGTATSWTVYLDHSYSMNQLVVQADNNDSYQVQYRVGSSWVDAADVGAVAGWGLMTRSPYDVSFTTNALRVVATGGDGYYALGQIEAFGTAAPELSTWAMMLAGFAALGFAGYRGSRKSVAALA